MSWSDRPPSRRWVLLGLAALAGCGFAPVYAPGGGAGVLRGAVSVEVPATQDGFRLRQRLLDRLGRGAEARFHLSVDLAVRQTAVGVTSEQETTRYNLPGTASYTLTDRSTGAEVLTGEVTTFTSYSATGTAVSTEAAERDARDRLAGALADRIVARLSATAASGGLGT